MNKENTFIKVDVFVWVENIFVKRKHFKEIPFKEKLFAFQVKQGE